MRNKRLRGVPRGPVGDPTGFKGASVGAARIGFAGDPNAAALDGPLDPLVEWAVGISVVMPVDSTAPSGERIQGEAVASPEVISSKHRVIISNHETNDVLVNLSAPFIRQIKGLAVVDPKFPVKSFRIKSRKKRRERRMAEKEMKRVGREGKCMPCECLNGMNDDCQI